tara:strand:- start:167 stop:472 length:306 start_codon:yes stop_codon:yes gene_type:complete
MKYFAKVVNNLVVNIVKENAVPAIDTDFYIETFKDGTRFNFAIIGGTYDATRDAFIEKKPYPSWTLNEAICHWEAPTAYPEDGSDLKPYIWNEATISWDEM